MRSLFSFSLLLLLVLMSLMPDGAVAQTVPPSSAPTATRHVQILTPYERSLHDINVESGAGTALYAVGVVGSLLGAGVLVGVPLANVCINFGGGSCDAERERARIGAITGASIWVASFALFFVGLGLDVDSGHRRTALGADPSRTTLRILPSTDGATVMLTGSF